MVPKERRTMAKNARSSDSWERQKGETPQAFEAFKAYCEMGDERSIRKVAQELGKTDSLLRRWSSRWNWVERTRDYDNDIRLKELRNEQKAFQEMRKRQRGIAIQLQKIAFDALKKISPESLTVKDIREFLKLGAALERANINPQLDDTREIEQETAIDIYLPQKDGENDE